MSDTLYSDVSPIGRLEIQLLRSFLAISKAPTLSSAALSMNIPQPTMSLQMKRLEDRTGRLLFEPGRRGKPLRLSVEGERLVRHAERIIEAYDDAVQYLAKPSMSGKLRVGIPELISESGIGVVLSRFKSIHGGTEIKVVAANSDELKDLIIEDEIDVRICCDSIHPDHARFLWSEPFHWVCASDRKCMRKKALPIGLISKPEPYRKYVVGVLNKNSVNWNEFYTSDSMVKIYGAVASGKVIAAIPKSLITKDVVIVDDQLGLEELSPIAFAMYRSPHTRDNEEIDTLVESLGEFIEDKMDQIVSTKIS